MDANGGLPAAASPGRSTATTVSRRQSGQSADRLPIACGSLQGVRGM
jgi:hypothetical protein